MPSSQCDSIYFNWKALIPNFTYGPCQMSAWLIISDYILSLAEAETTLVYSSEFENIHRYFLITIMFYTSNVLNFCKYSQIGL